MLARQHRRPERLGGTNETQQNLHQVRSKKRLPQQQAQVIHEKRQALLRSLWRCDVKTIYQHCPPVAAAVATMKPIQKAARAASSLKLQREYLNLAREALARRGAAVAAMWILRWKEERQVWAHLVNRV